MRSPLLQPFAPADPYYGRFTLAAKSLPDRREVHLLRQTFNLRVAVTDEPHGLFYEDAYCFHDVELAWRCFETWDGRSEPEGWAKRPFTGDYGPCPCPSCSEFRSSSAIAKQPVAPAAAEAGAPAGGGDRG